MSISTVLSFSLNLGIEAKLAPFPSPAFFFFFPSNFGFMGSFDYGQLFTGESYPAFQINNDGIFL